MKKGVIIGICAGAAVIATGLIVAGVIIANQPEALLARAITNDINDFRNSADYKYMQAVSNGGSFSATVNLGEFTEDDLYVQYQMFPNVRRGQGAVVFGTYDDDMETLATMQLNYSSDRVTFSSPEVLDDDVYGVDLKNLEENIEGSFLDPEEEGRYAVIGQYLLNLSSSLDTNKGIESASYGIAEDYRKLVINAIVENSEVEKSSETITVAGEKIPCTVVTVTTDIEGLSDALLEIIDYAEDDDELEEYLRDVLDNGYQDIDEVMDEFYDGLDEMKDTLEDAEDAEGDLIWNCYITKSGTRLARVDFEMDIEDEGEEHELTASLVLGKRINNIKELSFSFNIDDKQALDMVYTVKEDSKSAFNAVIEIEVKDTKEVYNNYEYDYDEYEPESVEKKTSYEIELDWDKKSGDYVITFEDSDDGEEAEIELEFNYLVNGGTRTLSFADMDLKVKGSDSDEMDRMLDEVRNLELVIVFERRAKAPKAPRRFEELTDMDEDDFEDLLDDIEEEMRDIMEDYV